MRGNYISYDAQTEFYQVTGGGTKAATANNPDGRVRAIMQPKSKDSKDKPAPQGAPVTLKPAEGVAAPREEAPRARRASSARERRRVRAAGTIHVNDTSQIPVPLPAQEPPAAPARSELRAERLNKRYR